MSRGKKDYAGAFSALRELAGGLAVGESSHRLVCIFCGGGSSRESSLSLTRISDAETLYHCFRASCGRSGRIACPGFRLALPSPGGGDGKLHPAAAGGVLSGSKAPKLFTGVVQQLGSGWTSYLLRRFGLRSEETAAEGWSEDTAEHRLVIPLRNTAQIQFGVETRSAGFMDGYDPRTKARLYYSSADGGPNYPRRQPKSISILVVVEDAISALKVSRHYRSCALHGTNLSHSTLNMLKESGVPIVLALDKDAVLKAKEYQKKYSLYCDIRVAVLDKDFKDEPDERIIEIVEKAK